MTITPAPASGAIDYRAEFRAAAESEALAAKSVLREHAANSGITAKVNEPLFISATCEQRLAGGISGQISWHWLYIDMLWVEEVFRQRGLGRELMLLAEKCAREKSLTGIYLWTQNWQAPGFYQKLGYEQFVELADFPPGHSRLGFRKHLV